MTDHWAEGRCLPLGSIITGSDGSTYIITNADNHKLNLCAACDPRPRDGIVGYLRKDGVVTVHREGCHMLNSTRGRPDAFHRRLKLGWGETDRREARLVMLNVDVYDRSGLLFEITQLMKEKDINIPHICTFRDKKRPGELMIEMELEVTSPRQMVRVLHQIEALVNVKAVRCISEGDDTGHISDSPPRTYYKPE
jgi:(p)ppGpp synthase/HD superfamily hydrolase